MKKEWVFFLGLLFNYLLAKTQTDTIPYVVKKSVEFESPGGHTALSPLGYGSEGIVQVNIKGIENFSFQKFSSGLTMEKEKMVSTKGRIDKRCSYDRMARTKNKTYLFVRNTKKEKGGEGIDALEFFPDQLDFAEKSVSLFETTGNVKLPVYINLGTTPIEDMNTPKRYSFILSADKTKFTYTYTLESRERRDDFNKDIIGLYVFDEGLNRLWGGEYEMPYTEAMMDNLGYTLANDGKVYMLIKVFGNKDRIASIKKQGANYHYEVLVYQKDNPTAKAIEIKLDNYFSQEAYIYEDLNQNIVIAGFYSKAESARIDGAYMVKLEVDKQTISRLNGGTYEIPSEVIKSYLSDWEKRKLDKREKRGEDIGIYDLKIRNIATTPNGSIKIVAEQYQVSQYYDYTRYPGYSYNYGGVYYVPRTMNSRTIYTTKADDIFVFSINSKGVLEWVKKIPKAQHGNDATAEGLSMVSSFTGNDVNIFYLDNIKNDKLPVDQSPHTLEENSGGYLTGVQINMAGKVSKYNLGDSKNYKPHFYIRYFMDGGNNNLIRTEHKQKKNSLFSVEVK